MNPKLNAVLENLVQEQVREALRPYAKVLRDLAASLEGGGAINLPSMPRKNVTSTGTRRGRPPQLISRSTAKALCAIIGCKNPARSKGYCVNHYQKFHKLELSHRLPPGWTDPGKPQTVNDVTLPRGKAGAEAIAAAKKKGRKG